MSARHKTQSSSPKKEEDIVYSNTSRRLEVLEDILWAKRHQEPGGPLLYRHGNKLKKMNLLMVLLGGGIGGVFQAGMCEMWQKAGLSDLVKVIVTISSGAPNGIALASGDSEKVVPFYMELPEREFINLMRWSNPKMKLKEEVIDPVLKKIDLDRLRNTNKRLYAIVTEWETGMGRLVPLRVTGGEPDWKLVMQATMTVPGFSPAVGLTGINPEDPGRKVLCGDGAWGVPMPLGQAFKECRPTHVVVMGCRPDWKSLSMWEPVQTWWYVQLCRILGVPSVLREKTHEIDIGIHRALMRMCRKHPRNEPTTKYIALFPSSSSAISPIPIWPFTAFNSMIMGEIGTRGGEFMGRLIDEARLTDEKIQVELV